MSRNIQRQVTTGTKQSNSPKLSRYKYAKPNSDLIPKKKLSGEISWELNQKSTTSQVLLEKSLKLYYSIYHEYNPSPFIYDRPVTGQNLLNYKTEKERVLRGIKKSPLVIVYGASGYGKTSLALSLQEELRKSKEVAVGYVSFRGATSEWELVKRYIEAMFMAMGVPDYRWGPINKTNFNHQLLINCYDLPTNYVQRLGKKLIAIVDDFDEIYKLKQAEIIEARFRCAWLEATTEKKLISSIVLQNITLDTIMYSSRKRAINDNGISIFLENIPDAKWLNHIRQNFKQGNKSIEESVVTYIVQKMNHIPRKIQSLCHHLYLTKSKVLTTKLVDKQIANLLEKVSWLYEARLGLLDKLQQAVLFSYADQTELKLSPLQQKRISRLMDEFVFYYGNERVFRDPLLETYILKRNNINPKRLLKKWGKFAKSEEKKDFDNKEWTWK